MDDDMFPLVASMMAGAILTIPMLGWMPVVATGIGIVVALSYTRNLR